MGLVDQLAAVRLGPELARTVAAGPDLAGHSDTRAGARSSPRTTTARRDRGVGGPADRGARPGGTADGGAWPGGPADGVAGDLGARRLGGEGGGICSAAWRGGRRSHRRWEMAQPWRPRSPSGAAPPPSVTKGTCLCARGGREEAAGLARGGREEDALLRPLLEKGGYGSRTFLLCATQTGERVLGLGGFCWRRSEPLCAHVAHQL